jgi:hypothetical protein
MALWLQDGVGGEALEALGEVVGEVGCDARWWTRWLTRWLTRRMVNVGDPS